MEPDIIRMYSSSPPPLDNGAEDDDDDEFGEFGGFSEVSPSGVGFVDFDTPDYTRPKEEFVPSNHFMPIHDFSENVDSLTSFKSIKNGNDKDIRAELSPPVKGQTDVLLSTTSKEIISSKTLDTSIDGIESPEDLNTIVKQRQNVGTPESFSPGDFRTDMNIVHQNKQLESCNGEKPPCLEILTNGFAVLETVNPQGTDDLDIVADSKGRKPLSTHSTEYNLDCVPSPAEEFADFATFSKKERIQLEEIGCEILNGQEALTIQENNKINRVSELNSVKAVSLGRSFDEKGDIDGEDQVCVSEINRMSTRDFSTEKQRLPTLQQDEFLKSSVQSKPWSLADSADNLEASIKEDEYKTEEKLDLFTSKCADLCMDSIKTSDAGDEVGSSKEESKKFTYSQSPSIDPTEESVLDDSISVKNGDSSNDFVTCNDTNEDEFGDFGTASGATPPFVSGTQDSMSDITFEESSEHFPHFSEPGDDFGEFGDTNAVSCQDEIIFTESDLKQTSDSLSEECKLRGKSTGTGTDPISKLEIGQEGEFGDFDSVPNIQDDCSAFQDSDDFADFSSAGPSQVVDWNAFEDGQKDSCSWAAFGDQATESHHRKEAWQSHRTDEKIDTPGTPKMHSVPSAASKGAVAGGHLQETATSVQTALLNRLERIFEACFPSILIPDTEEEVTSLKHLLETSTFPLKTREALAESGELLDVWTELQDIHDAHGLRYQWGGSHSNKKLLCSLGIDTRNILFTGNKKQPVIVPMYAAGLGMLEPTKEPLKPLSAAEKIASIGQTNTMSPEMNTCTSDQFQESLPPVQFDWSSSGLTNPLDASGGSTLLNLDFFGPVDDSSSSSSTTIPGVDPELYELTTSKLEISTSSLKVTDAFARLMSTVEKTSTSTRKPKREEHLSEEAIKVIASLPDLTFMHAKVLMFPATLTPSTRSQEKADG
ncbi:AFTPH [Vulpes lagopus]|uniref:aftiphilin isoform X1 n=1 Tax=Vulpes lagopus TaxID=494514 RepID=UPI001BC963DC|nr:aftiphilin isoform X1 [Vulpes lagopus]XP_041610539.1 aftiphilin isoform X1 [Vulpes lagopus]